MLRFLILPLLMVVLSCSKENRKPTELVQAHLADQCDSMSLHLNGLASAALNRHPVRIMQEHFHKARYHYKQLEPITELYFAGFSDAINGPAIDEVETYEDKVIEATGFQVVEEVLFSDTISVDHELLARETDVLASMTNRLRQLLAGNDLTDGHVFQSVRLQLLRVAALGITGFDSPIALNSLQEAKASIKGIDRILGKYDEGQSREFQRTRKLLWDAMEYLSSHDDFDSFDRAEFIRTKLQPLSHSVYEFQQSLSIPNRDFLTAMNFDKGDFLQSDAFNLTYFANPANRETTEDMIELGRLLFFDPVLSGNNKRSCASCHNPTKGFTDGNIKSVAFESANTVSRNAPTVINSAFQRAQFYDSRIMFQEDQVIDVLSNPTEMHGQIDEAVLKLQRSNEYVEMFRNAFPKEALTNRSVQKALAAYIRSLSSMNSTFDRYMRGESSVVSQDAIKGFNLFMGKAKCATCHFMPLFNGSIPPMFVKSESEVLGVPHQSDTINARIDPDLGKFAVFGGELNKHAFKTPTVRNAGLTAPYMHNGVYTTLDEVIDFYNRGGGAGIGIDLPNQTLPPDPLLLTVSEKRSIISFIEALTDTTGMTRKPDRLPSFGDPRLDKRNIGGEY